MGFMDTMKGLMGKILPSKDKLAIRNNVPKEKENIKKSFGVYCNKNHGTREGHLCNKCNALLLRIMTKMKACPYGTQAKPVCEMCDVKCFGPDMKQFLNILEESKNKMLMKHPVMAAKHRLLKAGTGYAKNEQEMKNNEAARSRRMAKREKARAKKAAASAPNKEEK